MVAILVDFSIRRCPLGPFGACTKRSATLATDDWYFLFYACMHFSINSKPLPSLSEKHSINVTVRTGNLCHAGVCMCCIWMLRLNKLTRWLFYWKVAKKNVFCFIRTSQSFLSHDFIFVNFSMTVDFTFARSTSTTVSPLDPLLWNNERKMER